MEQPSTKNISLVSSLMLSVSSLGINDYSELRYRYSSDGCDGSKCKFPSQVEEDTRNTNMSRLHSILMTYRLAAILILFSVISADIFLDWLQRNSD